MGVVAQSPRLRILWAWLACAGLSLALYAPALQGPLLSDDQVVVGAAHVRSWAKLGGILDPWGAPAAHTANYAPLHLLAHALANRLFGANTLGHHVVNVLLHATNALLLGLLFRRTGLARPLAAFGGLVFLVHPANVEAVAWIFQLKTQLSFGLAVGALLWLQRRPAAATALFLAALLCKIQAVFALPVAAMGLWLRPRPGAAAGELRWLLGWLAIALLVAVPELSAFRRAGELHQPEAPGLLERIPFILEIAVRYVLLALTSIGASSFHQPAPPASFWSPGPLLGALLLGGAALRALQVTRRRHVEALWWVWTAATFLPISQIFPFQFPMADRYLYFMLPGLLGVLGSWAMPWVPRKLGIRAAQGGLARRLVVVAALALLVAFAAHSTQRAAVWSSAEALRRDAARNYPEGIQGQMVRAKMAMLQGEHERALRRLEAAVARGYSDFEGLSGEPAFASLRDDPRMQALLREMAATWVERTRAMTSPTAGELQRLGRAHAVRGEHQEALAAFEQALARAEHPRQARRIRVQILRMRGALARAAQEREDR